jgi:hypothetical protein
MAICDDHLVDARRPLVALDVAPVRDEPAGVGTYVVQLARALAALDPGSLALIGVRPQARAFDHVDSSVSRTGFSVPRAASAIGNYHAWIHLRAAIDGRATGATLAHYTNGSAPLRGSLPYVVTVHDLSVMRTAARRRRRFRCPGAPFPACRRLPAECRHHRAAQERRPAGRRLRANRA